MVAKHRRASNRRSHKAPIRYLHTEMDQYYDAYMYNYCSAGMYFEAFESLKRDDRLHLVIPDHRPDAPGPARYPYYLSQVCWCRELAGDRTARYGVGVAILKKSTELQGLPIGREHRECDMCGERLREERVCRIDGRICLCPDCFYTVEDMPEGSVKENIKRKLIGNII